MNRRSMLVAPTLLLCLLYVTGQAAPSWFANLQLSVNDVVPVALTQQGLLADVTFTGYASGPYIVRGTVAGVDHAIFDASGNAILNVYLTITDRNGDQISANITGFAIYRNSGQHSLEGTKGIIINEQDPISGVFHATTGKFALLLGASFEDVGIITAFSFVPPAGLIHASWYL